MSLKSFTNSYIECPDSAVLIDACLEAGAKLEEFGPGIVKRWDGVGSVVDVAPRWITLRPGLDCSDKAVRGHLGLRGTVVEDYGCTSVVYGPYLRSLFSQIDYKIPDPYSFEDIGNL